ncbi:MAG: hypothetical protein MUC62_05050 [Candidatus Thermoplasmatota archaeon]|jgi:hypothetical protein|nr:hypothetical protein [Candidatus Thermoplasmatota archaeon]
MDHVPSSSNVHEEVDLMRADMSRALDRKLDLYGLVPLRGKVLRDLISAMLLEVISRRRKVIFLCNPRDMDRIEAVVREQASKLDVPPLVGTLSRRAFVCPASSSLVDPADVVHHCTGLGRLEGCPYQASFDLDTFRLVRDSGGASIPDLEESLRSKGMCPAKVALDIASEAPVLISEHSFLFNEGYDRVLDQLGRKREDLVLAICDPLSLIDHIRERFIYSFSREQLQVQAWDLSLLSPDDAVNLTTALGCLSGLLDGTEHDVQIDRKELLELYSARTGQRGLGMIIGALKTALDQDRFVSIDQRRSFKDLYMLLKLWTQHYTAVSRSVDERDGERRLVLSLADISVASQPLLSQFPTTVLFGDTFYPHELYANILGARFDRAIARTYGDGRQMKRVSVVSLGNVDTSFRNRDKEHFSMIARNLERVLSTTPGTSLVLFPSYLLLEDVCSLASLEDGSRTVIRETKGMGREEREQLREEALKTAGATLLSVQGGTLMRAMEDGALVPDSVVMVGLHIPPPSVASNQQRLHMQSKLGHDPGHKASVIMPAITKVMKIVNGMTYGANGKDGLVVLMDKRYQDRRVLECFPRSYGIKILGNEQEFSGERFLRGDSE